jgi:hypothetical protein
MSAVLPVQVPARHPASRRCWTRRSARGGKHLSPGRAGAIAFDDLESAARFSPVRANAQQRRANELLGTGVLTSWRHSVILREAWLWAGYLLGGRSLLWCRPGVGL